MSLSAFNPELRSPAVVNSYNPVNSFELLETTGLDSFGANAGKGMAVAFIDSSVTDYQTLINGIDPSTEVVVLDANQDGIQQITDFLLQDALICSKYSAIHIISHGSPGSIQIGSSHLGYDNITGYAGALQQWQNALTADADILLYGCDVANISPDKGEIFLSHLAELTRTDVAASDDKTGSVKLGGDWILEYATGKIEAPLAFQGGVMQAYNHILPTTTFINEILFNSPGTDSPNEYIELRGTPSTTLPSGTYLVAIDGDSGVAGMIDNIFNLSGQTFGSNGFLVLLQKGNTYSVNPSASVLTNTGSGSGWGNGATSSINHRGADLENGSNSFLLIQTATAPNIGDDIDSNDDGTPDGAVYSGWTVLDSVAILDGGITDTAYGSIVFRNSASGGLIQTGAVVVNNSFSFGQTANYVGRSGNTTGSTISDWVASVIVGSAPNWALGAGSNTSPSSLAGRALNHIGAANFSPNTPPVLDLNGGATGMNYDAIFIRGGNAVAIVDSNNLTLADDGSNISSAVIRITNLLNGAAEVLSAVTTGTNINATYNNGILVLTGSDTVANYQQVLRSIAYNNTAIIPNTTSRTIEFVISDGSLNSSTVTTTLAINMRSPIFVGNITGTSNRPPIAIVNDTTRDLLYQFSVSANTRLVAELTCAGGNADLALYDINGNLLGISTNAGTLSERVDYSTLNPGNYYIRVYQASSGQSVNYRLRLNALTV
jgi:Domain of unknown function (DUF4347)/Bacterial pre-peptidase C-terminal domain